MASDEEISREIRRYERARNDQASETELQEYRETASEIHDELARRIQAIDEGSVDESALSDVVDKLESLEDRLEDLEERL